MSLNLTILSDESTWFNDFIPDFIAQLQDEKHTVRWVHSAEEVPSGDLVFILSCGQILSSDILARNRHNLVVHESDLPRGKGWSPLTWQVLVGENSIPICLFEAVEQVDGGVIYLKDTMHFEGTELVDELREVQAKTSIQLCRRFLENFPAIVATGEPQAGEASFYPRRKPEDSRLSLDKTLGEQFNLLRVVDNDRYPAFFEVDGCRYRLTIQRDDRGQL